MLHISPPNIAAQTSLKQVAKYRKYWLPFVVLFIFLTSGAYASATVTPTVTETVTPTVTSTVTETATLSVTSDIPTITPTQAPTRVLYEMVMFKCGVKGGQTIEPNISENLSKIGISATYEYDGNKAYVFAIVKNDINLTWLAVTNLLMPLSKEEEEKYKETIVSQKLRTEYLNGTLPIPTHIPQEWAK